MSPLSKSEAKDVTELAARARANFRPTAEQKELYIRAASITGQSLSDFMRTSLEEVAKRVIAEHERIVLHDAARDRFLAALSNPPKPNERLVTLIERYAREVESRP